MDTVYIERIKSFSLNVTLCVFEYYFVTVCTLHNVAGGLNVDDVESLFLLFKAIDITRTESSSEQDQVEVLSKVIALRCSRM